jgi:hypothetical protein
MPSLRERLVSILEQVLPVEEEADGGLTVRHDGTFASLQVVNIAEDLDLVSLTQVLAWDLPLTKKVSALVAKHGRDSNFGSVIALQKEEVEKTIDKTVEKDLEKNGERTAQRDSGKTAAKTVVKTVDVMLRYNFPGAGLTDDALRTLILLVLDTGAQMRSTLTA